jgi:serine protease Do
MASFKSSYQLLAICGVGLSLVALGLLYTQPSLNLPGKPAVAPVSSSDALNNYQLALRTQTGGSNPTQTMFGNNPNLVADVAEQVAPSVVNIDIEKRSPAMAIGAEEDAIPFMGDELFRRFFGLDMPNQPRQLPQQRYQAPTIAGNGSGVIIDIQGHILTNYHVVAGADKISVTLNDGRKLVGKVVGKDRFSDLAVIKITADKLKPATLGYSATLRPGEWVLAIGSPLGFDHTVTLGIVSALSRRVPDISTNVDFIQTDAAINPGNSGGPLVNLKGQVVGINTAISGNGQNIGFAIPVDVVKQVSADLVAKGVITRPWIGLAMTELNPDLAKSLGLPDNTQGVIVSQVIPGSPSAKAGFLQGDVIQHIDGKTIRDPKTVQGLVRTKPVATPMRVQVLRDGQMIALSVKTEALPADTDLSLQRPAIQR